MRNNSVPSLGWLFQSFLVPARNPGRRCALPWANLFAHLRRVCQFFLRRALPLYLIKDHLMKIWRVDIRLYSPDRGKYILTEVTMSGYMMKTSKLTSGERRAAIVKAVRRTFAEKG